MTKRAVLLGFLGVVIICSFTYFNNYVLHQHNFIASLFPISIYGSLILCVLLLNPLLFKLSKRYAFSRKELIVIITIEEIDKYAIWGCRIFIIFSLLFIVQMTLSGLDWQLSVLYTIITMAIYLVMSRLFVETGLYYILPYLFSSSIIWGMLGTKALGPRPILIMCMFTLIFTIDKGEAFMPYIVNSLKMLDFQKIKLGKPAIIFAVVVLVALAISIPVSIYLNYDHGADKGDNWFRMGPPIPFNNALYAKQRLERQGILEESEKLSGWNRFKEIKINKGLLIAFLIGLGLVLSFNALRLRYPGFPIHPVMFVIWWSWGNRMNYFSFLLGFLIKAAVMKYGGIKLFQKLKPFMIGMIAGEITAKFIPIITGTLYYYITGDILHNQ